MQKIPFHERLKFLRKKSGLTIHGLAYKAGISQPGINCLEVGKYKPTFDSINKLCDALDCSADYLLGRTECKEIDLIVEHINNINQIHKILKGKNR